MNIIDVKKLNVSFEYNKKIYSAIKDISFNIKKGEVLGIVGESGCGKTLTSLALMGLLPQNASIKEGNIIFNNKNLITLNKNQRRKIIGKEISMIFQEPMTSLNPLMKVGKQISENITLHNKFSKPEVKKKVFEIMKDTGLSDVKNLYNKYPHELSGGMRQRIIISIAIANNPNLIIADEPTTALDVTIQAQIIELLKKINKTQNSSMIFISHDMGLINEICDKVAVMYYGYIVESGNVKDVFYNPRHPYTQGLIKCIPTEKSKGKILYSIPGKVPTIYEKIEGCPFYKRCPIATKECSVIMPKEKNKNGYCIRCHKVKI